MLHQLSSYLYRSWIQVTPGDLYILNQCDSNSYTRTRIKYVHSLSSSSTFCDCLSAFYISIHSGSTRTERCYFPCCVTARLQRPDLRRNITTKPEIEFADLRFEFWYFHHRKLVLWLLTHFQDPGKFTKWPEKRGFGLLQQSLNNWAQGRGIIGSSRSRQVNLFY